MWAPANGYESMYVDKALGAQGNSDVLLEEVVKAYNLSTTPEGKIMALSLVANNFTFKQLCRFNPPEKGTKGLKIQGKKLPKPSVDETGENVDDIQALLDSDDDDSDESNKDSDLSTDDEFSASKSDQCVYWKPELNFYFYQRARLHYRLCQGAVQPLIVPRKNNWKISFDVLRTIIGKSQLKKILSKFVKLYSELPKKKLLMYVGFISFSFLLSYI